MITKQQLKYIIEEELKLLQEWEWPWEKHLLNVFKDKAPPKKYEYLPPDFFKDIENIKLRDDVPKRHSDEYKNPTTWHRIKNIPNLKFRGRNYGTTHMRDYIRSLSNVAGGNWHIEDISRRGGGKLGRHVSHQTGIDADISLPWKDVYNSNKMSIYRKGNKDWNFRELSAKQLDLDRTIEFLKHSAPYIKRVLLNKIFHQPLKNKAKQMIANKKLTQQEYNKIFKKLEHWKGHKNHFHVRLNTPGIGDPHSTGKMKINIRRR